MMKTENISLRVTRSELARWREAARVEDRSLASLIRFALNQLIRRLDGPDFVEETDDENRPPRGVGASRHSQDR